MINHPNGMALGRYDSDPKLLGIMLARYKVVAKLFEGMDNVLEVGCNDGFGARVVRQHVEKLTAIDCDDSVIKVALESQSDKWHIDFLVYDIMEFSIKNIGYGYDGVYCLDVFEHIRDEDTLMRNLAACAPVCIIGTPSLESQKYATDGADVHVNCVTASGLRERMKRHWKYVFIFGQNDETLHVGYDAMRHYNFGLGIN